MTNSVLDPKLEHFCFEFPATMGSQGKQPFYMASVNFRALLKIFSIEDEGDPANVRHQRTLNKSRIPGIAKYLLDNPDDFVLPPLTASIGSLTYESKFKPQGDNVHSLVGTLSIPMDAQLLINDGQHRLEAIRMAVKENHDLMQNHIGVMIFKDDSFTRSQQIFADLNKYGVKPSQSISTLYDFRDKASSLARHLALETTPFKGYTELEKSSIGAKSGKIFTLSAIKQANQILLSKNKKVGFDEKEIEIAEQFWNEVSEHLLEWNDCKNRIISAHELRQNYISGHGIGLLSIASWGQALLMQYPDSWKEKIVNLVIVDWKKSNSDLVCRCMDNGRLLKSTINVQLVSNYLKIKTGMPLTPDEKLTEKLLENNS